MAKSESRDKTNTPPAREIAIIGIGCLFPKASDTGAYWASIRDGVDAISDVPSTHWRPDDYFDGDPKSPDRTYARRGGFLDMVDFEPLRYGLAPNDIEATDTTQLLGLMAAERALADAGYPPVSTAQTKPFDRSRVSVILGVTGTLELVIPLGARLGHPLWRRALDEAGVDPKTADDVVARIADGYVPWQENSFPGLLGNVAAGRIANRLDLHGTNCVVDAACASSLSAIHMAGLELESGRSDIAVTGGVDTFNDIFMYMCFSKTPALSPNGDAKPFANDADGTILGEGLGIVVLKRLADAERDGDRVYAVIRGLGSSSDGKGNAIYAPSAVGQARALRAAYREAGIRPDTIELIEAHGTGTKVGDAVEVTALNEVYRSDADPRATDGRADRWCALGSVKSQIGHTKAAAGAAGLIKAALALYHKVLPPTIKVDAPAEAAAAETSPFYVNTEKRPWLPTDGERGHPRRAAVSSFGFGGSNFHCVLEEHRAEKTEVDWSPNVQLAAFSGDSAGAVRDALDAWETEIDSFRDGAPAWNDVRDAAARSRRTFTPTASHRVLFVLEADGDVSKRITQARQLVASAGGTTEHAGAHGFWSTPDGCCYGIGEKVGELGVLFPGQGSQYVGMLRDLCCQFPEMLEVLAEADEAFARGRPDDDVRHGRLSDHIYPQPKFDDAAERADDDALRDTRVAQPAIGAVSAGAFRVLERFGVQADAVAGHSFGELTALFASGRISTDSLHALSNLRGRLMGSGEGDRGSMLAVRAPTADIEAVIDEENIDLVIANRNAPNQSVVSGRTDEVERAAAIFESRAVPHDRLPVSAAFHSALVADARAPFEAALADVDFARARIPTFANTTAAPYPDDATEAKHVLAGQLAQPVVFVDEIENMYDAGVRTFIEVGPGPKITGLVKSILGDRPHEAFALDQSRGRRSGAHDLASLLARLSALGHTIDVAAWDASYEPTDLDERRGKRLIVPLNGANYMRPRAPRPPVTQAVTPAATPRATATPTALPPEAPKENAAHAAPPPTAGPIADAIRANREALVALQRLQAETAALHRQFLENQMRSHEAIQHLLGATPGVASQPFPSTAPRAAPPPAASPSAAPLAPPPISTTPAPVVAPTAVPTEQTAPSAPTAQTGNDREHVARMLLATVAEKTGYPAEMLDLSMGLDADLGIDSIKRVEILSALEAELPGAPQIGSDQLGSLHTLADVVDLLASAGPDRIGVASPSAGNATATTEAAGSASTSDVVAETLLSIVAEKTGYPSDMLDLSMGLDADLGIDSIKRVEILSAVEAALPDADTIGPDQLGTLHTLADVVDALGASAAKTETTPAGETSTGADRDHVATMLLRVVAEKTGYPTDMLDLSMGLDADLGIDSIKRVEILSALEAALPDAPTIGPDQLGTLHTLTDVVDALAGATPEHGATTAEDVTPVVAAVGPAGLAPATSPNGPVSCSTPTIVPWTETSARTIASGSVIGIAHTGDALGERVAAAFEGAGYRAARIEDDESIPDGLAGLVIVAPSIVDDAYLRRTFAIAQRTAPALRAAAANGGAVFVTVTRLGGAFGLDRSADPHAAISGGLAGLTKTAAREWPEVGCRALDVATSFAGDDEAAAAIVGAATTSGPVELGLHPDGDITLKLAAFDPTRHGADGPTAPPVQPGDVVVITGGARGVTASTAIAVAAAWKPTILLLGRSQLDAEEDPAFAGLSGAALKRAIVERAERAGDKPNPKTVGQAYDRIVAASAARETLRKIDAAGGRAAYCAVDVRDADAVASVLRDITDTYGPIRGLIHGAGVLADKLIVEKTLVQFDRVYGTKVGGLAALLGTLPDPNQLRMLALFSSSTARFGRIGQSDYAIANEAMNKIALSEAARRPDCRVIAFNWGPWDGGMVTPALREVFAREGIGVIPRDAGVACFVDAFESAGPDTPIEIVVLGPPPTSAASAPRTTDQTTDRTADAARFDEGAVDREHPVPADANATNGASTAPTSTADVPSANPAPLPFAFERRLDLETYPVLSAHVLDGHPVVPKAIIAEWLAHGAMHGSPGLAFLGFDGLRICKGIVLDAESEHRVRVGAAKPQTVGDTIAVDVEMRSSASGEEQDGTLHAFATVRLAPAVLPGPAPSLVAPTAPGLEGGAERLYRDYLFHGSAMQSLLAIDALDERGLAARCRTAPAPSDWIARPLRRRWVTDPAALDAVYQAMIVWTTEQLGAPSLPTFTKHYRQFVDRFPAGALRIIARITDRQRHAATADIELSTPDGQLIARIQGYECAVSENLRRSFEKRDITGKPSPSSP